MIIFNSKAYPTNYMAVDNTVIEIFAPCSLEEFFDKLIHGEEVDNIHIKFYKEIGVDEATYEFRPRLSSEETRQRIEAENFAVFTYNEVGAIPKRNEFQRKRQIDLLRADKNGYRTENDEIENNSKVLSFNGVAMTAEENLRFDELPFDRKMLLDEVKDALEIDPDDTRDDEPIAVRRKRSSDSRRLMWELKDHPDNYTFKRPSFEEEELFLSLSNVEKRIITSSFVSPHYIMEYVKEYKRAYPSRVVTEDLIRYLEAGEQNNHLNDRSSLEFYRNHLETSETRNQDSDIARADTAFKSKFRGRSPRILNDLILAYRRLIGKEERLSDDDIADLVSRFNVKSSQIVAQTGNLNLLALSLACDLSVIKKGTIEVLKAYVTAEEMSEGNVTIPEGSNNSRFSEEARIYPVLKEFCAWFSRNGKSVNEKDLTELLRIYRRLTPAEFSPDYSAKDLVGRIENRRAIRDMNALEREYRYKFSDNVLAIRGRDIVVEEGRYKMYMLPADDLRNFTVGYNTSCCQHFNGAGETCVWKLTTDPFAGVVVIEDKVTEDILAQSFVWTDEIKDTFVFDNIEFSNDGNAVNYKDILGKYVSELPYENVHMGTGYTEFFNSWGEQITPKWEAKMPDTLGLEKKTHIIDLFRFKYQSSSTGRPYTDYHVSSGSKARIFKKESSKGSVMKIPAGFGKVSHVKTKPTIYDALLGRNNFLRFFLERSDLTIEQKIESANALKDNPTPEALDAFIRSYPAVIKEDFIKEVPEDTQRWLMTANNGSYIKYLKDIPNPIPDVQEMILDMEPSLLEERLSMGNISDEVVERCLRKNGRLLAVLPEITPRFAQAAVESNGFAIEYVPEELATDDLIRTAVNQNPDVVSIYRNLPEDIKEEAVRRDPDVIGLFDEPSDELQILAAELYPASLLGVKNPCERAVETALMGNWHLIRNYARGREELARTIISMHPEEAPNVLTEYQLTSILSQQR